VLSVVFGSLLSGSIVALVTGLVSDRLARSQEDGHLRAAAATLAFELQVKGYDPVYAATDEAKELAHTGIAVAIFEGDHYVAGELAIPPVAPGACVDVAYRRVCAVLAGRWVTLAARDRMLTRVHRELTARSSGIALIIMSLLSTGIALALAYAAVKPLDELARAVQHLPAHEQGTVDLGHEVGVQEVDALRSSLQVAFDDLCRVLAQSRNFAGDAAHQLRTPLATIIGELELALEAPGERGRQQTARAHAAALRLSALIDRLLILVGPDEAIPATTPVSLQDVVGVALDTLPETARARIDCESTFVELPADPGLLAIAIVSALENSLEFSSGRVRVSVGSREEYALVAVEDDGPGIPTRDRERLLQLEEPPSTDCGIALAVIARVTARHGGALRFAERAAGTRLEMTFARGRA
jgi:signal transduction histidine kinase